MSARLTLVVAYSQNRCIGKDNKMLWHLPADLAHFKQTTLGHPIIMGRKTHESIGRALPGRRNLIISRQRNYAAADTEIYNSLESALQACGRESQVFIIGGAQIYAQALGLADTVVATEIQAHIEGDAYFPELPKQQWQETERQPQTKQNGYQFDFVTYQRISPAPQT